MPFQSPFTGSRIASIFGGGNPFQSRTPPFVPEQSAGQFPRTSSKRFMTSILPTPNPVQSDMEEDSSGSSFDRYFDLLQKSSQNRPKQTAYEEALRSAPNREDYRPSGWRRFAAILGGAAGGLSGGPQGGIGVAEHILRSPYQGALEDYEMRVGAAEQEAKMELADRSDYRENLKTAATLGQTEDTRRSEIWNRRRQREIDQQKAETDFYEAQSNRQNIISQINRRLAETNNETERRELERQRVAIEKANTESLADYRRRTAGAAETTAGAAAERARKYTGGGQTRMPQVDEQQAARDLVLEEMSGDDRTRNFIKINQDKYGPAYIVDPRTPPELLQEIQERIDEKMQMSYPGFRRRETGVDRSGLGSSFEIGDLVNPGRQ